jgi:hypothetical protein
MADSSGQADIRGIDIDKLAKGFADEEILFKRFVTVTPTAAREIRWYQKTAGFLDSTDTTGITASQIANVAELALPVVVEQSWTRNTSYVRKYFVESPTLSDEDIRDSDIDILATNVRDLTRAVEYQVDQRIWDVMTQSRVATSINFVTINVSGTWSEPYASSYALTDPIKNIMAAKQKIRSYGYNPEGGVLFLNSHDHAALLTWLISTKGSSIPAFASQKIGEGVVMEILGLRVVVSENVTSNFGAVAVANRAVTWKQFMPVTARTINEPLIGTKIRIAEEGEAILTDPRAVCLLSGTGTASLG